MTQYHLYTPNAQNNFWNQNSTRQINHSKRVGLLVPSAARSLGTSAPIWSREACEKPTSFWDMWYAINIYKYCKWLICGLLVVWPSIRGWPSVLLAHTILRLVHIAKLRGVGTILLWFPWAECKILVKAKPCTPGAGPWRADGGDNP